MFLLALKVFDSARAEGKQQEGYRIYAFPTSGHGTFRGLLGFKENALVFSYNQEDQETPT